MVGGDFFTQIPRVVRGVLLTKQQILRLPRIIAGTLSICTLQQGNNMSISEITERVSHLGSAWEQFKQVNDNRLREIERKGSADGLYT